MNDLQRKAKAALDLIIKKSCIHLYKPIQIAEILYHHRRQSESFSLEDLDSYRNSSKRWRDDVSSRLVGRVSTSSARFQDNVFDDNAMPSILLNELAAINEIQVGMVEAYIYFHLQSRLQDVITAYHYVANANTQTFALSEFLDFYEYRAGLRRSVDKAYEIVVYALFSTLVASLDAQVSVSLNNPDPELLGDFEKFIRFVLGITPQQATVTFPARLFRAGVTNAADRGLDMWANYGPAVQVKHIRLSEELAEGLSENIAGAEIVVVCKTAEARLIESLLNQVGLRIRGIITQNDLEDWYWICQHRYADRLGESLLANLRREFENEFPMLNQLDPFLIERGYSADVLVDEWVIG